MTFDELFRWVLLPLLGSVSFVVLVHTAWQTIRECLEED